jgi:carbonic anhydrase
MSNLTPFLDRNRSFAGTGTHEGLSPMPSHQLMVVTCMDGRVDPAHVLGVELGDALVIRNAGGRITDDVLAEIAFVGEVTSMMFGDDAKPFEVAVLHHTACGTGLLADPSLRRAIADRSGVGEELLAGQAVTDPFESVRNDVDLLRSWSGLPERAAVSGHVYDVDNGLVTLVVDAARAEAPGAA